jgi:hypothetical protein
LPISEVINIVVYISAQFRLSGTDAVNQFNKENHMLWIIAAVLATIWWLGLLSGYSTSFLLIHLLIIAAIVLLVISVKREVNIYDELKEMSRPRK